MFNENNFDDALKNLPDYNNDMEEALTERQIKEQEAAKATDVKINNANEFGFPDNIADDLLEKTYIGIILNNIKDITLYYFTYDEACFVNKDMLNIYKKILFTDGEQYAPREAKDQFNFAKETQDLYQKKLDIKSQFEGVTGIEKIYMELKKLFIIRKAFLKIPVRTIQEKIAEITCYELYDKMDNHDVEAAIEQILATDKFKRAVLNSNLTEFLIEGDNIITNGLSLPFPILTKVFKGIRLGETASFAMPSNCGKSRFTINLAAYMAIIHEKKVLIISNEMPEEKMKLCLLTTILNNSAIQAKNAVSLHVSENQLIAFKFRPDITFDKKNKIDTNKTYKIKDIEFKVDENGFVLQNEKEPKVHFAKRLMRISTEFRKVLQVTNYYSKKLENSIHFVSIVDHTNDELKKIVMNYYYKEDIRYVFYDTMKTDIENIGNGEELKKTATILSNLAQEFNMYIGTTLQLAETDTNPINLSVKDMAVSRTVKEVLDTLCLFKQIYNEDLDKYEYSLNEVDTVFYDIIKEKDPDFRYYSCVVDKNRAGEKPKLLFKLNLAYNYWEELGYIRMKSKTK